MKVSQVYESYKDMEDDNNHSLPNQHSLVGSINQINPAKNIKNDVDRRDTLTRVSQILHVRKDTIKNPSFIGASLLMMLSGSFNYIASKGVYQSMNLDDSSVSGPNANLFYVVTYFLTFGSVVICSLVIIEGRQSFKDLTVKAAFQMAIPGCCDLVVNSLRYLRYVHIPIIYFCARMNILTISFKYI